MNDGEFSWRDHKAKTNQEKHKISFELAKGVFRDPFSIEWFDDRKNYNEDRYCRIGMVKNRFLFVAYTIKNNTTRLISARVATAHERRLYYEENNTIF